MVLNTTGRCVLFYSCNMLSLYFEPAQMPPVFDYRYLRNIKEVGWKQKLGKLKIHHIVLDVASYPWISVISSYSVRWPGHVHTRAHRMLRRVPLACLTKLEEETK